MNKTRLAEKKKKLIRQQNESNREIKRNERRQKRRENLVEEDIDLGRFFENATSNKTYGNNLNLHETKYQILQDYAGDFELIGKMIIGPIEHKTNIRFQNMDDFERYINALDVD